MPVDSVSTVDPNYDLIFSSDGGYVSTVSSDNAVNSPVDGWDPSQVTPGAKSWTDVLTMGVSRLVDAQTRTPQSANVAPVLARPNTVRAFTGTDPTGQKQSGLEIGSGVLLVVALL